MVDLKKMQYLFSKMKHREEEDNSSSNNNITYLLSSLFCGIIVKHFSL